MSKLRIVYNNAASRANVFSASTTAGSLVAGNMLTESKSEIHRSTSTSVTYNIQWPSNETVGNVTLPCTNLSSTATIRVRLYDVSDVLRADSGVVTAVPGYNLDLVGQTHNVNLFAIGYVSKTAVWFTTQQTIIRKCTIDIVDTSNAAGFIDCSRIVVGEYWESTYHVENGIQLLSTDDSSTSVTNAGELVTDIGFIRDKANFNFSLLPEVDRAKISKIIKYVGTKKNLLVSILTGDTASIAEQDFLMYGRRSNSALTYRTFGFYNHSMEITSW